MLNKSFGRVILRGGEGGSAYLYLGQGPGGLSGAEPP